MVEIVGVGFMSGGKSYYFDPAGERYEPGDLVIVETARGLEMCHITIRNTNIDESTLHAPLKAIVRRASAADIKTWKSYRAMKPETVRICEEKIAKHNLDMKLIDAEYTIDGSKIIFYFSAEGRVDFRDLVKDLAARFHMRIELRQVGVRDEARMTGGIGICGRPFCCSKWMNDFQPVSIKMAKQQNLSLNPAKISGSCGRLMCCLNFENDTYKELRKGMPSEGDRIITPDGPARVAGVDLFTGKIAARVVEKDKDTGEESLSSDISVYFKNEVRKADNRRKKKKVNDYEGLSEEEKKELAELKKAED